MGLTHLSDLVEAHLLPYVFKVIISDEPFIKQTAHDALNEHVRRKTRNPTSDETSAYLARSVWVHLNIFLDKPTFGRAPPDQSEEEEEEEKEEQEFQGHMVVLHIHGSIPPHLSSVM